MRQPEAALFRPASGLIANQISLPRADSHDSETLDARGEEDTQP